MDDTPSRRMFLGQLTGLVLGFPLMASLTCSHKVAGTGSAGPAGEHPSPVPAEIRKRLVEVRSGKVLSAENTVNSKVLEQMLTCAMERLTACHGDAAWQKLFSPSDMVALKVNCLAGKRLSTHRELVNAIVSGLTRAGVQSSRIIIYDRTSEELRQAGFSLSRSGGAARCFGTDEPGVGYDEEPTISGEVASRFSTIISRECTALINVPVLKDHDLCGLSAALKNHLGSIDNPNKYHPNGGDPYIADINASPLLLSKSRLIICDALEALYDGGPAYNPAGTWSYGGILAGCDPVALDTRALSIIEAKRREMKLPTLSDEKRFPHYIARAADSDHRVGEGDFSKVEHMLIDPLECEGKGD
ncbi:MAG: DUF362 domain-containing protein [Candidatus Eremiobacteraeota bacterium]|nr:DUF362 domain-containing protein [Candidatus Eremiobacteraeota bacterium]